MELKKAFDTVTLANQGVPMTLHDLTGEPCLDDDGNPITITLMGEDSDKYNKLAAKTADERTNRGLVGGRIKLKTNDLIEEERKLVARCTVSWSGIYEDGQPLECTAEIADRVYREYPEIYRQCRQFMGRRANYLGN